MMTIYTTQQWNGFGKQNYYWNEYRLVANVVHKIKCHKRKFFDGDSNEWIYDEAEEMSWVVGAEDFPEWLNQYLQ